jgi:electron transport complex protein RnfE
MNKYIKQLKEGLLDNNPTLVQLLGMCPTLATTTSVENAFGMGLAATAVLICSNLFISLLRKFIPKQVRIAAYIVII